MRTPKGVRDLLPDDAYVFQKIEAHALEHFGRYGFREIRTPIFEETGLFLRSIGDETDIVNKEMYRFKDKGGRDLTLRPEATASVCRAVMQHNLVPRDEVVRLMYSGPMFRHEQPQAGRFRQFFQIGVEVFGSADPLVDVETIEALMRFLSAYGLPNLALVMNSVGDATDRPGYLAYLKQALDSQVSKLCPDCRTRLERNVLRVLDCKNSDCRALMGGLKPISEFWSDANHDHFRQVCEGLEALGIPFTRDPMLVRGLDYYTRTAFEVVSGDLGAQSAVMGGGRYDSLIKSLGGKHEVPAFGWAMGVDRLATLLTRQISPPCPDLFLVFTSHDYLSAWLKRVCELRAEGLTVLYDIRVGSMKSQMKRANRERARYAGIVGESEFADGTVTIKNMTNQEQLTVPFSKAAQVIQERGI